MALFIEFDAEEEKTTARGTLRPIPCTKYHSVDPIMKNKMGEARSTCGGKDRFIQVFGGKN